MGFLARPGTTAPRAVSERAGRWLLVAVVLVIGGAVALLDLWYG